MALCSVFDYGFGEALACCGVLWVSYTVVVSGVPSMVGAKSEFYAKFLMASCAYVVGDGSVD